MQILRRHSKFFHEIVSVVLMVAVIAATFSLSFAPKSAQAATYYMTQDSWSGGASASTFSHPFSTSTNIYYSSSSGILAAGNLTVSASSYSFTDDGVISTDSPIATGGGFGNGTNSSTTVSGSGTAARVQLNVNGAGTGSDGSFDTSLGSSAGGCNGTGMSWNAASSTCTLNTGTKAIYNFTSIVIATSTILTATSSSYLTLLATDNIIVNGTINLNGGNGENGVSGQNCVYALGGSGGSGSSSGGAGGRSGEGKGGCYASGAAGSGSGAGGAGWYIYPPVGGGGGGGFGNNGGAGGGDSGAGGSAGSSYSTENVGGSGGGGGSTEMYGQADGGGGGGGGGSLKIVSSASITINSSGIIKADGGNGGTGANNPSGTYGSAAGGGGGSGGRINLISLNNEINGVVSAKGGAGGNIGTEASVNSTGGGGGGSGGRISLTDSDGAASGSGSTSVISGSGGTGNVSGSNGAAGGSGVLTNSSDLFISSGTFESANIDYGGLTNFNNLTFSATTTNTQTSCTQTTGTGCAIKIQLATSNSSSGPWTYYGPDGTTGSYYTTSSESIWSGHNSSRYFRYKTYLATTNTNYTPYLNSITINNTQYPTTGTKELISSKYDAGNSANLVDKINWTETSTSTTETVKFQIKTASSAAGLDSATWCGSTVCDGNEYFSSPSSTKGVSVALNHPMKSGGDDQWFQYRVILASGGGVTPAVDDVVVTYVVNAPPDFDATYGTNGILINQIATTTDADWGKALIQHRARDIDTTNGVTPLSVSTTFAYRLSSSDAWTTISNLTPNGANRSIAESYITTSTIWDAKSQIGQVYSTTTQIKVTLYDGEAANHTGSSTSAVFTLDTKNPATASAYAKIDSSGTNNVLTLNISDDLNIQYRVSNNSDFSNDGNSLYDWQTVGASSTTATSTWTLPTNTSGNEEVVYYNVRDVYNNAIGTSTIVVPGIGSNITSGIIIKDVSNLNTSLWDEFISWVPFTATSGAAFSSYQLYRSTDGTNYSSLTTISDSATNYYRDTGLSSSTTYYYKVRFADTNGDISQFSNVVSDQPDGSGGTDITPPVLSAPSSSEIQSATAKITWTADKLSDSRVIYGTTSGSYPSSTYVSTWISDNGTHTVYLTGLAPSTIYYYKVSSRDPYGNSATSSESNFTTLSGPQISNISCSNSADNSITVIWNTNATTTSSYVDYSTNSTLSSYSTQTLSSETFTESSSPYQHKTEITGLTQTSTYYLRVGSTASGVTTVDNNSGNFYVCKTTRDAKPPVISNILTPVKSDTAIVVTWDTDEPASSQVFYDTSSKSSVSDYTSYTTETTSPLTRTHVVSLTGLTKEKAYYFRVRSRDMNPDSGYAASSEQTATTTAEGKTIYVYIGTAATAGSASDSTPPSITDLKISNIGSFNATIDFNVSENATAFVDYGQTADYGFTAGSSDFKTSHSIKLSSLKMGADYKLRVKAIDKAGNSSYSEQQTLKTKYFTESVKELVALEGASNFQDAIENAIESVLPSIVPPFIEKPEVADITENSALIKWKTNVPAYSVVVYSSEKDYDILKVNPYSGESSDTDNKKTNHEINLLGLNSNTKYHYMAKSFVLPQAVGKSNDLAFVTKAARIKPKIADIDNDAIRIIWTTDKPASSIIEYKNLRTGEIDKKIKEEKIVEHDVKIENLIPDTNYEITITGYGEDNNLIEAGEAITVRTSKDVAAPTITGLKIDGALVPGRNDRVQTVVSWRTDEPANSTVEYGEGSGGAEEELKDKVGDSDVYSENHNIILSKLKPGTLYRMRVTSIDDAGNKTASPIRTIITPRQSESIVDVIVKNFEDTFQFLKKIK